MRIREHYLTKEETLSDSQTKYININIRAPISWISLLFEATNGTTSCLDHEIHDDVTAIEVIDGANKLFSLSMIEALALNFYELGRMPYHVLSEGGGDVQKELVLIHFGRYPGDPEYYLDPTKFTNPQVVETHALTISSTAGFQTGTGKLTVIAHIIEEGAAPQKGFMMSKSHYAWSTGSAGEESIDLPTDYVYRLLLVKALLSTNRFDEVITRLKLSIDADAVIPFDLDSDHLVQLNEKNFGLAEQFKEIFRANGDTFLMDIFDIKKAVVDATAADTLMAARSTDAEQVTITSLDLSVVGTPAWNATAEAGRAQVRGSQVHATVCYPFGRMNEPGDWLPAPTYGRITLKATQAIANAAASVVLQQLRK